jgi:transposase
VALPTLPDPTTLVTLGVDTHAETHVAVALDRAGRLLGTRTIPTTPAGYAALLAWASTLGPVDRVGVEATGSYGAGLGRWLRAHGQTVVEVDRPDRAARRRQGKADTLDAHAAARVVQAGTATGTPKGRRRPGGDDPLAAASAPLGGQGPHPGRQPAGRAAGDRAR